MNKSTKKESNNKAGVGPGGFHCACCNPFPGCTKKQGKAKLNRVLRRANKQNLTNPEDNPPSSPISVLAPQTWLSRFGKGE